MQHCAFPDCIADLQNAQGGALCGHHEIVLGSKCRMIGCNNNKTNDTEACRQHAGAWQKHPYSRSSSTLNGIRRVLQRERERQDWQPHTHTFATQPHDEDAPDPIARKHYFSPGCFYCVETACAPCGVVLAWTKFAKAESPTNILQFLATTFPTPQS